MKKLTLEMDALRVESFEAAAAESRTGTVQANENLADSGSVYRPCFYTEQPGCNG